MSYTYDALGRVLSETSRGITHSYSYDLTGNRVRADYGTVRSVQTSFDARNRPESIVEGERATRYGYDLGGRAVILMAGNGQVTSNSYDALGRLKERTLFRTQSMGETDVMARFSWEHDLLGNVTTQSETWPGEPTRPGTRSTSMAYDANNRLIHETVNDTTAGVTTTAYAYDAANNRSRVNGVRVQLLDKSKKQYLSINCQPVAPYPSFTAHFVCPFISIRCQTARRLAARPRLPCLRRRTIELAQGDTNDHAGCDHHLSITGRGVLTCPKIQVELVRFLIKPSI